MPQHLLDAALRRLLDDEYRKLSTRQVAAVAATNVSMIRYHFANKEGLYEEMNRATLQPLLDVLDGPTLSAVAGISDFFRLYDTTMAKRSKFPKLIFRVLALNQGLGKRFIHQLLEQGRTQGRTRIEALKDGASRKASVEPDTVRMSFVSLAMTPMLLKGIFKAQMGRDTDAAFLEELARFNGRLLAGGLGPTNRTDRCALHTRRAEGRSTPRTVHRAGVMPNEECLS